MSVELNGTSENFEASVTMSANGVELQALQLRPKISVDGPTDGTLVRMSVGETINLGNYQSLRLDVSVQLPTNLASLDSTVTQCADYVDMILKERKDQFAEKANAVKSDLDKVFG
jgi:hypothetical protein